MNRRRKWSLLLLSVLSLFSDLSTLFLLHAPFKSNSQINVFLVPEGFVTKTNPRRLFWWWSFFLQSVLLVRLSSFFIRFIFFIPFFSFLFFLYLFSSRTFLFFFLFLFDRVILWQLLSYSLKIRVRPSILQKPSITHTVWPRGDGQPLPSTYQDCTYPCKRFRSAKSLNTFPKRWMCLFGESNFWPNCKGKSRFSPHRQALGGDNPKNLLVYARPQPAISLLSGASHTPWNILHSYGNNPAGSSMNYD